MSGSQVVQFKMAFNGTLAKRDAPMLSGMQGLPDSVKNTQAVQDVMDALEAELGQLQGEAVSERTGKRVAGRTWVKDGKSTLKAVSDALANGFDTDALEAVTGGKGQAKAQAAIAALKDAEKQLQQAVADELLQQADNAANDADRTHKLGQMVVVVGQSTAVATGVDEVVERFGAVLERKLGLAAGDLATMTAAEFKAVYLDAVVAPAIMNQKAARVTTSGMNATTGQPDLDGQLSLLAVEIVQISFNKLTVNGDAARIHALLTQSNVGNKVMTNMSTAGKFTDEAWPKRLKQLSSGGSTSTLKMGGNQDFQDKTSAALSTIDGIPEGRELFKALAETGHDVAINPPTIANAQRVDAATGTTMFSNSAGCMNYRSPTVEGRVAFDPDNNVTGEDVTKVVAEPWRERDPSVVLYHEMIHTLIANKGGEIWHSPMTRNEDKALEALTVGFDGDVAELRIVGIDYKTVINGKELLFPFSDATYNPISENAYRRGFARAKGDPTVNLRPNYMDIQGQQKMPNGPSPV